MTAKRAIHTLCGLLLTLTLLLATAAQALALDIGEETSHSIPGQGFIGYTDGYTPPTLDPNPDPTPHPNPGDGVTSTYTGVTTLLDSFALLALLSGTAWVFIVIVRRSRCEKDHPQTP